MGINFLITVNYLLIPIKMRVRTLSKLIDNRKLFIANIEYYKNHRVKIKKKSFIKKFQY